MLNRIEELKKNLGLSTRALALKCGMNQPTLDRMLKGINALNLNCVTSILEVYPEVSAEWLIRGKGEMFLSQPIETDSIKRINSLLDTISTLQDTINNYKDTVSLLKEENQNIKNQLKNK